MRRPQNWPGPILAQVLGHEPATLRKTFSNSPAFKSREAMSDGAVEETLRFQILFSGYEQHILSWPVITIFIKKVLLGIVSHWPAGQWWGEGDGNIKRGHVFK